MLRSPNPGSREGNECSVSVFSPRHNFSGPFSLKRGRGASCDCSVSVPAREVNRGRRRRPPGPAGPPFLSTESQEAQEHHLSNPLGVVLVNSSWLVGRGPVSVPLPWRKRPKNTQEKRMSPFHSKDRSRVIESFQYLSFSCSMKALSLSLGPTLPYEGPPRSSSPPDRDVAPVPLSQRTR